MTAAEAIGILYTVKVRIDGFISESAREKALDMAIEALKQPEPCADVPDKDVRDIIRRLKNIANHAVHVPGEKPFVLSLDDGIALFDAAEILSQQIPAGREEDEKN